jgi:hypothetical protein
MDKHCGVSVTYFCSTIGGRRKALLIVIESRFGKAKEEWDRRRGFFLFASFSFFKEGCGNVENPQTDRLWLRTGTSTTRWLIVDVRARA